MTIPKVISAAVAVCVTALSFQQEAMAKNGGTSILHLKARVDMARTDVDADAEGHVRAKMNRQGKANNQRLEIAVSNLDSSATHSLMVLLGSDTELTKIADFDTDSSGAAMVKYVFVGSSRGHNGGHPGGQPLPIALNPISNIRELEIRNAGDQTVLVADLTDPYKLQYLVKRSMTNDGVDTDALAALRIKATENFVQFRIRASGLDPSTEYSLAINGTSVHTLTTDADGKLDVRALPDGSPDILDIHSLAILNGATATVLSTMLP